MIAYPGLVYREDYFADPAGWKAIKELLQDIFDIDIGPLERLGGPDPTSMPSAWFDGSGRCIANLSAFSMPLVVDGRPVRAAGLQSGAVRPEWRGRGLFRSVLTRTLQRIDEAGFEAALLYTDKPALYEPHGFVGVPQFVFEGRAPVAGTARAAARRLDIGNGEDIRLLRDLLARRQPVSSRFAVAAQTEMFLLNSALIEEVHLDMLTDLGCAVAWHLAADGTFELLDVVGPDLPPLATIVASLALSPERVVVHFPPDRLGWEGTAAPEATNLVFMVRGATDARPAGPYRLSPMAEF